MVEELVSVVVPAYNARATLGATLASVCAQTHRALEVIVVDDGSTDGTAALAGEHAARDRRVRVLSVANGGVARARNIGVAASRGAFVAPVDADDLWHPSKIARQMAVMRAGGPGMGFVYTLHRRIDAEDRVLYDGAAWNVAGRAYLRAVLLNFVGNGSSLLIRRAAFDEAGGYEPDLHRRGAQGCEDYLLQILIARSWTVGVVPEYLTGYRLASGAMSADWLRMERSRLLALEHARRRFPETPAEVLAVSEACTRGRLAALLVRRAPLVAAAELWRGVRLSPAAALAMAGHTLGRRAGRFLGRLAGASRPAPPPAMDFLGSDPAVGRPPATTSPIRRWLAAFAEREEAVLRADGARGGAGGSGRPRPALMNGAP